MSGSTAAEARARTRALQRALDERGIDVAVLADEDNIAYFGGFWGYLGMEFGRPTLMLVRRHDEPIVITPLMEQEMVAAMTWVADVRAWEDAGPRVWAAVLARALLHGNGAVPATGVDVTKLPPALAAWLAAHAGAPRDIGAMLADLRMVKSPTEIAIMRQAGQVAVAMVEAARAAMAPGVPEYEIALAVMQGGTRAAAALLGESSIDALVSPLIHDLQILQSGTHTAMVHRRAGTRRLERGDPVYLCFCNLASFKHYRLGFDRQFFLDTVSDEHARVYETTVAAQQAALAAVRPGVTAASVHAAAEAVYRAGGFAPGYRTGRAIGVSYLERPELKAGDETPLRAGMTFAVDGGITLPGRFGARIGDSIVVTDAGFEYLTEYPRTLTVLP